MSDRKVDVFVDFNARDADNVLIASKEFLTIDPDEYEVGDSLILGDFDGNTCRAEVIENDPEEPLIYFFVEMSTWESS